MNCASAALKVGSAGGVIIYIYIHIYICIYIYVYHNILGYIVSLGFVKDIQWVSGQYKNPGDSLLDIYIYNYIYIYITRISYNRKIPTISCWFVQE